MKLSNLVAMIALVALNGCDQRTSSESRTTTTTAVDTMVTRGAPVAPETDSILVALGNEPFWNVRVTAQEILYRDPEHQDGYRFPLVPAFVEGDGIVYRARREIPPGEAGPATLELRIRQGACSDGMSDNQYSMIAWLKIGEVTHTGCAMYRADTGDARTGGQ